MGTSWPGAFVIPPHTTPDTAAVCSRHGGWRVFRPPGAGTTAKFPCQSPRGARRSRTPGKTAWADSSRWRSACCGGWLHYARAISARLPLLAVFSLLFLHLAAAPAAASPSLLRRRLAAAASWSAIRLCHKNPQLPCRQRVGSASPATSHSPTPASRASEVPPAAVPQASEWGLPCCSCTVESILHGRVPYPARTPIQYRLRDGREDAGPARILQPAAVVAEEGVLDAEVNRETLAVLAARRTARRTASVLCTDSYSALGVRFQGGPGCHTPLRRGAPLLTPHKPLTIPQSPQSPSLHIWTELHPLTGQPAGC
ncbi:hypothetical protein B0T24DRAFT_16951 [Lasiosphaeria ovina]|uniref:Uncharacterized protein n=1 Tax=Lasiosphaeria ovina TaxID=92902 RepID=A0AAE0NJ56_9PEZI|nr:hypothetical protein B0T24DRAFT_16951 [Lasiosphaeria ovina]